RGEGVDVSDVELVKEYPTSLNFKEIKEDGSGSTYYYRYNSPISTLEPEDITDDIFQDVDVVHLTVVFLSLDEKNRHIVKKIIEIENKKEIVISFDLNIRLKLWTIEEARKVFYEIFPYVDILLTGLEEIELIIGESSEEAMMKFANDYRIQDLVIKDGGNGSRLYRNGVWTKEEADRKSV